LGINSWALILGLIIESASKSKKIERHLRIQNLLLGQLLEKQGMPSEEVIEIINQK
jgi:hypothetical protein